MASRIVFVCCTLLLSINLKAQQFAKDWTKNDCRNNTSFNVFSQLDSGYVIVQEYVMMHCYPCEDAADGIKQIIQPFSVSHPGRVKVFQTAYDNATMCSDLITWADTNGYSYAVSFEKGASEMAYYGHGGMPAIVVIGGGNTHKVFYNNEGYNPSTDSIAMNNAIALALLPASLAHSNEQAEFSAFPNPSIGKLTITSKADLTSLTIASVTGSILYHKNTEPDDVTHEIDLSDLCGGIYILTAHSKTGGVHRQAITVAK
jgi:hypothetical protein